VAVAFEAEVAMLVASPVLTGPGAVLNVSDSLTAVEVNTAVALAPPPNDLVALE